MFFKISWKRKKEDHVLQFNPFNFKLFYDITFLKQT